MTGGRVVFETVWKKFQRGERHDSLRDLVPSLVRRALGTRQGPELDDQEFWALKNVSFEVGAGQALGIIGPNGAGKSTVLKLLSRILKPTRGQCSVRGRVGAIIEVAAGFHQDLTGRENVYLQGAIMGMKRAEIASKLDEIIEFAGVRDFIDTPIKRYSSGMNARLGFSIAAHLNPEVLLIDEVLAVGDLTFQQRCYERMRSFRDAGVAIVFVSHNLSAVASLCSAVLVLRSGEVQSLGPPDESISTYVRLTQSIDESGAPRSPGESLVELMTPARRPLQQVAAGEDVLLRALVKLRPFEGVLATAIRIRRVDTAEMVYFTTSTSVGCSPLAAVDASVVEALWQFTANLGRGHYSIELIFFELYSNDILVRLNPAAQFSVHESESEDGVAFLRPQASILRATTPAAADVEDSRLIKSATGA